MRKRFTWAICAVLFVIVGIGFTGCTNTNKNFAFKLSTNEISLVMGEADESGEINTAYVTALLENGSSDTSLLFRIENEGVIACEKVSQNSSRAKFKVTALNPGTARLVVFSAESSTAVDTLVVNVYKHIESVEFVDDFAMYIVRGQNKNINFDKDLNILPLEASKGDLRFSIVGEDNGVVIGETTGIIDATNATSGEVTIMVSSVSNPEQKSTAKVYIVEPIKSSDITITQSGVIEGDIIVGGESLVDELTLVKTKENYAMTTLNCFIDGQSLDDVTISASVIGTAVNLQRVASNSFAVKALELGTSVVRLSIVQKGAIGYLEPVIVDVAFQVIDSPSQINLNGVKLDEQATLNVYNNYEETYLGASMRLTLSPTSVLESHSDIRISLVNNVGITQLRFYDSKYRLLAMSSEGILIKAGDTIYIRADNVDSNTEYSLYVIAEDSKNYGDEDTWVDAIIKLNILEGILDMSFDTTPVCIKKGQSVELNVGVEPITADTTTLTNSGSNEYYSVQKNSNTSFVLTGLETGDSYFTVYRGNGSPITTLVRVYEPLTEMSLEVDEVYNNVNIGQKDYSNGELSKVYVAVNSTIDLYVNYNNGATIQSINYLVEGKTATVKDGRITMTKEGESTIKVVISGYDPDNDGQIYSIEKKISVVGYRPISSISLNILNGVRYNYETVGFYNQTELSQYNLQALVYPQNATYASEVQWSIADKSDDGVLSGSLSSYVGANTIFTAGPFESLTDIVVITASVTEFGRTFNQTCTIEVRNATMIDSIILNNVANDLISFDSRKGLGTEDNAFTVSASAYPISALNRKLRYSYIPDSGDSLGNVSPVFSVDATGKIIPLRSGSAVLRISAEDSFINSTEANMFIEVPVKVNDGKSLENAFYISTPKELVNIGANAYSMSLYYVLTADIDLKDYNWTPLGASNKIAFTGYLSGNFKYSFKRMNTNGEEETVTRSNYYKINNLTIDTALRQNVESYYGLFYKISSNDYMGYTKYSDAPEAGTVRDLTIDVKSINIDCSNIEQLVNDAEFNVYVGALAGSYTVHNSLKDKLIDDKVWDDEDLNDGTPMEFGIINVSIINNSFIYSTGKNNGYIGGLVGYNSGLIIYTNKSIGFSGKTIIVNDKTNFLIQGTSQLTEYNPKYTLGGLVGENTGVIKGVYSNEINPNSSSEYLTLFESEGVTVTSDICGNIGLVSYSENIKSTRSIVGGVVGTSRGILEGLASENTVNGRNNVGGLVGKNYGTIKNCLSASKVKGVENVGGLAGYSEGTIERCAYEIYETNTTSTSDYGLKGTTNVGGLVGYLASKDIKYSYALSYVAVSSCYDLIANDNSTAIGGFVGYAQGANIYMCYSNLVMNVSGVKTDYVAGVLVGNGSNYNVNWCNTTGGLYGKVSGGFANNGTVTNSYYSTSTGKTYYKGNGSTGINLSDLGDYEKYFISSGENFGELRYVETSTDESLSKYTLVPRIPKEITTTINTENNFWKFEYKYEKGLVNVLVLQYYDALSSDENAKAYNSNFYALDECFKIKLTPNEGRTTRIKVISGSENVVKVVMRTVDGAQKAYLNVLSTGYVSLTLANKVKESISSSNHIYNVNSISEFKLYPSLNTDKNAETLNTSKLLRLKKDVNQSIVPMFRGYTLDGVETKVDENIGVRYTFNKDNTNYIYDVVGAVIDDNYIYIDDEFQTILTALAKTDESINITATPYVYIKNIAGTVLSKDNRLFLESMEFTFDLQVYLGATNIEFEGSVEAELYSGTSTEVSVIVKTDNYDDSVILTVTDSDKQIVYKANSNKENANLDNHYFESADLKPTIYYLLAGDGEWKENLEDSDKNKVTAKKFVYKVGLTFDNKFISEDTKFNFEFNVTTDSNLKVNYPITFMPESIHDMYVVTYGYGEVDYLTGKYNPSEQETQIIVPGVEGLLAIDINPIYSDYDTIIIQSKDISFDQLLKKNYSNSNEYPYVVPNDRFYLVDGITLAKQYYDNNNNLVRGSNGKYYASMYLKTTAEDGDQFEVKVSAVKVVDGVQKVLKQSILTLTVQIPPGISIGIENQTGTKELYVPYGTSNKINVATKDYDADNIKWNIVNTIDNNVYEDAVVVKGEDGYYLNILQSAETGDEIKITAEASKKNARTATDSITLTVVDYLIQDIGFEGVKNDELREVFGGEYPLKLSFENSKFYYDTTNPEVEQLIRSQLEALSSTDYNTWYAYRSGKNKRDVAIAKYYQNTYYTAFINSEDSKELYVKGLYYDNLVSDQKRISATIMYYFDKVTKKYVFAKQNMENIRGDEYRTDDKIYDLYNATTIINSKTYKILNKIFDLSFYLSSSRTNAIPIYNANDFMNMESDCAYILMSNITLENFSPIEASINGLNGNNYTVTIKSYANDAEDHSGSKNIGLFEEINENCIIENLKIVIDASRLYINAEGYSEVNFGVLAGVNEGKIYNCQISSTNDIESSSAMLSTVIDGEEVNMGYQYSKNMVPISKASEASSGAKISANATGIIVQTSLNQIDETFVTSVVGGLVGRNDGYIVNCSTDVTLNGYGTMGGMVGINNATIASSKVLGVLNSYTVVNDLSNIGGFVGVNNGKINLCYADGEYNICTENGSTTAIEINASCYAGGFVGVNSQSASINNAFANLKIVSQSTTAGFVYDNRGTISNAYSTSIVRENSLKAMAFVGVDDLNNINNSGTLDYCYFLKGNYTNQTLQPVNMIDKATAFSETGTFTNFAFGFDTSGSLKANNENAVWSIKDGKPTINSANRVVKGYKTLISQDDSSGQTVYHYSALKGANLGSKEHPYVIYSAEDFNNFILEVGGNANSKYYVLASDITFNDTTLMANTYNTNFQGVFEGNGLSINNLRLSTEYREGGNSNDMGLFASIKGTSEDHAVVKNLDISLGEVYGTIIKKTGVLAGTIEYADISNINIDNYGGTTIIVQGRNLAGGLAGMIKDSVVSDIYINVGANAGYRLEQPNLYNADANTDNVGDVGYAGALAGIITGKSYVKGVTIGDKVKVIGEFAGGAVGLVDTNVKCEYANLVVGDDNSIKFTTLAGGLFAENRGTIDGAYVTYSDELLATEVEGELIEGANNSLFVPTITMNEMILSKGITIGGLVAFNNGGNIYNSYTNIAIVGKVLVAGGLVGRSTSGEIASCYSSSPIDVGITGINAGESESTMAYSIIGGLVGSITNSVYDMFNNKESINLLRYQQNYNSENNQGDLGVNCKTLELNNVMAVNNWLVSRCYYDLASKSEDSFNLNFIQGSLIGVLNNTNNVTTTFDAYNYYNKGIYQTSSAKADDEVYNLNETGVVGGFSIGDGQVKYEKDYFEKALKVDDGNIVGTETSTYTATTLAKPMDRVLMTTLGKRVEDAETKEVTYVPYDENGLLVGERDYISAMFLYTKFEFKDSDTKYLSIVGVPNKVLKLENLTTLNDSNQMQVSNDRHLRRIRDLVNKATFENKEYKVTVAGSTYTKADKLNFVMTNDIALNEENFTPIGESENHPFVGIFDGAGYSISGLVSSGHKYLGLFGYVLDSTITDLGLANNCVLDATANGATTYMGMIAYAEGACDFSRLYTYATYNINKAGVTAGALIGEVKIGEVNSNSVVSIVNSFTNFMLSQNVTGTTMAGLVGVVKANLLVYNVYTVGDLTYDITLTDNVYCGFFKKVNKKTKLYNSWTNIEVKRALKGSVTVYAVSTSTDIIGNSVYYRIFCSGDDTAVMKKKVITGLAENQSVVGTYKSWQFYITPSNWDAHYNWDFEDTWILRDEFKEYPVLTHDNTHNSNLYDGIGRYDPYTGWYYIEKAEHVQNLAKYVNDGTVRSGASGLTFVVFNDLDVTLSESIGNYANAFRGTFNGFGHKISVTWKSEKVTSETTTAYGFFGRLENAIVTNLEVEYKNSLTLTMKNTATGYLGGLAGIARYGKIDRVVVTNANMALVGAGTVSYLGGLVGQVDNETITRSYVNATIASESIVSEGTMRYVRIGGLVGYTKAQNTIIENNIVFIDMNNNTAISGDEVATGLLFGIVVMVDYLSSVDYNYCVPSTNSKNYNTIGKGTISDNNKTTEATKSYKDLAWDLDYAWGVWDDENKTYNYSNVGVRSIDFEKYKLNAYEVKNGKTETNGIVINTASPSVSYEGNINAKPIYKIVFNNKIVDEGIEQKNGDQSTYYSYLAIEKTIEKLNGVTYAKSTLGDSLIVISVDTEELKISIPDEVKLSFGTFDTVSLNRYSFTNGKINSLVESKATEISLGASVKSIGSYTFTGCESLTSVTFKDPNGWFVTSDSAGTSGTNVNLSDSTQNVNYLKDTYESYYWKKSA